MKKVMQDLRYTVRRLRRAPGFALTAVLTLALAIGATTTMYTIVRSTLLAPLPYPHATELVGVGFAHPGSIPNNRQTGENGDFLLAHATSFSRMGLAEGNALEQNFSANGGHPEVVHVLHCSAGYLPALGLTPLLGRTFTSEEDRAGGAPVVVLSELFWRRKLNADANVVGHLIHLNGQPYTVVGVLPAPLAADETDLWQALQLNTKTAGYYGTNFRFIGRLKPGATLGQASAEMSSLTDKVYRTSPVWTRFDVPGGPRRQHSVWPLQQVLVSDARPSLLALSAAVLAILLMACLNLASLGTARSTARQGEMAVRSALGAGRSAVFRLLLTESAVLALMGSLIGVTLAYAAVPVLLKFSPVVVPQLRDVSTGFGATVFAVATGFVTMLIFGLLPALASFRLPILANLGGTRTAAGNSSQQRLGRWLVVAQVALATVLLSAGALLLATFLKMRAVPSGVRTSHLYALQVNLKGDAYASSEHTMQFVRAVEERLRGIPGVAEVTAANGLPLDGGLNDQGGPASYRGNVEIRFVMPGYLQTAGMTLLAGSDFTESDRATTPAVIMINERAAKLWFPDRTALGEVMAGKQQRRVVGVVSNVHQQSLADAVQPTMYVPFAQATDAEMKMINGWFATTFLLRTADRGRGSEPDIAREAKAAVSAVDPEVPASKFAPMQNFVDQTVAAPRFFSWLAGAFASFALLLTGIGLFGLLSFQVGAQTREIGVRMALGADRSNILRMVLRSGFVLTAAGLVGGVLASMALRGIIVSLLANTAQIETTEVVSILGSPALSIAVAALAMLLAALCACLLPARRAASIQPSEALRAE